MTSPRDDAVSSGAAGASSPPPRTGDAVPDRARVQLRVLVAGGSGVLGECAIRALLARGHRVRLLARHADVDLKAWPEGGVEGWDGDVTDPPSIAGAADGCDVVLHLVGIVDEHPPETTFERVNVEGTRHMVDEAARAGVRRFVYASSLGAERGASPYHVSKRDGEHETARFPREWLVVRPGNVYGRGDQQISLLLRMVRALPAIPLIAGGTTEFQPVWADDVGLALALACERSDLRGTAVDVAGAERTSMGDLLDRFARLTGQDPPRVPIPGPLASFGLKTAGALGIDLGINEGQLTMLKEGNVVDGASTNALTTVFGIAPTSLDDGLRHLLDEAPEQLPADGVGALHRKRYWADVEDATRSPRALFRDLCGRFQQITPAPMDVGVEPETPTAVLAEHQTVTMAIPLRGTVQVRVAELGPTSATLQTVAGHPLAGAVRLAFEARGADVDAPEPFRFLVEVVDRAASPFDWLSMAVLGSRLQQWNWEAMVEAVIAASGGRAPRGVEHASDELKGDEATRAEHWLRDLALARVRASNEAALGIHEGDAQAAGRAGGA